MSDHRMFEPHFDIHHRIADIQQQLLELDRTRELQASLDSELQQISAQLGTLFEHRGMLRLRINAHAHLHPRTSEWIRRNQDLQADYNRTLLRIEKLESRQQHQQTRQADLRNQIPDINAKALKSELSRLRRTQIDVIRRMDSAEFNQLTETINAVHLHIVELDQALTLLLKVNEQLDEIIQHARQARANYLFYPDKRAHRDIQKKLKRAQALLHWLQRELWDTGLEFVQVPQLPTMTGLLNSPEHPIIGVIILPPYVGLIARVIKEKERQIGKELTNSHKLIASLRDKEQKLIDHLWRLNIQSQYPKLFKNSRPQTI